MQVLLLNNEMIDITSLASKISPYFIVYIIYHLYGFLMNVNFILLSR